MGLTVEEQIDAMPKAIEEKIRSQLKDYLVSEQSFPCGVVKVLVLDPYISTPAVEATVKLLFKPLHIKNWLEGDID